MLRLTTGLFMSWLFSVGLLLAFLPNSALAQQCEQHDRMLSMLEEKYQEKVVVMGIVANGKLMEVLASESGSWTLLITDAESMISCMLATGEGLVFEQVDKTKRPIFRLLPGARAA